jgi:hypothetical protein
LNVPYLLFDPLLTVAEVGLAAGEPAGEEEEVVGVNIGDPMGEEAGLKAEEPDEPALGFVGCAIGVSVVVLADVVVKPIVCAVGCKTARPAV